MNLDQASKQWACRPPEERFWTLDDLHTACSVSRGDSATADVHYGSLQVRPTDAGGMELNGRAERPAILNHYAFGQLAARVGAPAGYLRELPAPLVAQCLNVGLATQRNPDDKAAILFGKHPALTCRAVTSERYTRIWNADVTAQLRQLSNGWRVPPARPAFDGQPGTRPATAEDLLEVRGSSGGLSINLGDPIAPAGLYASDRDMFAFLVDETRRVADGSPEGLSRGFFVWNSEVGDRSFGLCCFLYRHCCGNHIVWDASKVAEVRLRHVGTADARAFGKLRFELRRYGDTAASLDEARIKSCRTFELGPDKEKTLARIFGMRLPALTQGRAELAWKLAEQHPEEGAPTTAWGYAQGVTRLAQETRYTADRVDLDRAAGKVLSIAF